MAKEYTWESISKLRKKYFKNDSKVLVRKRNPGLKAGACGPVKPINHPHKTGVFRPLFFYFLLLTAGRLFVKISLHGSSSLPSSSFILSPQNTGR
jgi:hypothetical protein